MILRPKSILSHRWGRVEGGGGGGWESDTNVISGFVCLTKSLVHFALYSDFFFFLSHE